MKTPLMAVSSVALAALMATGALADSPREDNRSIYRDIQVQREITTLVGPSGGKAASVDARRFNGRFAHELAAAAAERANRDAVAQKATTVTAEGQKAAKPSAGVSDVPTATPQTRGRPNYSVIDAGR
jgi:hypothetical protein